MFDEHQRFRTSSTSVSPFPIISFAWAGVILVTTALAASSICLTEIANGSSSHLLFYRAPH